MSVLGAAALLLLATTTAYAQGVAGVDVLEDAVLKCPLTPRLTLLSSDFDVDPVRCELRLGASITRLGSVIGDVPGELASPFDLNGAAISNAVANALGVRVPTLPMTPQRVLAALKKG